MSCTIHSIAARHDFRLSNFDSHTSFTLGPAEAADSDVMVTQSGWTLFAYDTAARCAVFLDIGPGVDLSSAPFCYLVQFERAQRLAHVPFDDLFAMAEKLPDPQNLVQLFNTGHCGSTLLHHVFNRVPDVWCISEPACFINMAMARDSLDAATSQQLARAALRFLMRFEGAAGADLVVVKHFSQSTTQMKTLHQAVPHSRALFMYRDGKSWTNSVYHFAQKMGAEMIIPRDKREFAWWIMSGNSDKRMLDGIVELDADVVTFDRLAAMAWVLHIRNYGQAVVDGLPMLAVRYNELTQQREQTIARIFAYCGIDEEAVAGTLSAFESDSQEGTRSARSIKVAHFEDENYERVAEVFANPRVAMSADVILPDGSADELTVRPAPVA